MAQQKVVVVQEFRKPVQELFAQLSDHNRLAPILGVPVKRIRDGQDDVNGVGSVRRMGIAPLALEETVLAVVPNQCIEYTISKGGGPIQNHHGKLEFSSTAKGSKVQWTIVFDSPLPLVGPIVRRVLQRGLGFGLWRARRS